MEDRALTVACGRCESSPCRCPAVSLDHRPDPGERWRFDEKVTACFDDMLQRSIPLHDDMRRAIRGLASQFVRPGTRVVDLGASRGEGVAGLIDAFGGLATFDLVERAPAMLDVLRARFDCRSDVRVLDLDLRRDYPSGPPASATLATLTLQFVPPEHRARVLRRAFESTVAGGALILVEKVLGEAAESQDVLVERYRALKMANGYSPEAVAAKAESLEGALISWTAAENERALRAAGFDVVECFWRVWSFAGWLAIRR